MISLLRALNIETEEVGKVALLMLLSFFLGIFIATYDVSANTLFLEIFTKKDLPVAFTISGIAGIFLTLLFTRLQRKINFSKLSVSTMFIITLTVGLLRLGIVISPSPWLIYALFILLGPLNVLSIVAFWGISGRLFTLRQGKRLFGLVDTGKILASAIAFFSIPLIINLIYGTENLLILSTLSMFCATITASVIANKHNLVQSSEATVYEEGTTKKPTGIGILFKSNFLLLMTIFVSISMLLAFFVHYAFMATASEQYTNQTKLAEFWANFGGTIMILSLLLKIFVYGRLMEMYGVKTVLIILPVLLGVFSIAAALIGTFMGYTVGSDGFVLFFLAIAVSKLFAQSLKEAMEVPAFKIFYQPLDKNIRFDIQSKIDGTINEISVLISGVILAGVTLLPFFEIIQINYLQLIAVIAWLYVIVKLYNAYRATLKDSLVSQKADSDDRNYSDYQKWLKNASKAEHSRKTIIGLDMMERMDFVLFEKSIIKLATTGSEQLKKFALKKLNTLKLVSNKELVETELKKDNTERLIDFAEGIIGKNKDIDSIKETSVISKLSRSASTEDRITACRAIYKSFSKRLIPILIDLLLDKDQSVRTAAYLTLSNIKDEELWPNLINQLNNKHLEKIIASLLTHQETNIVPVLQKAFNRTGQSFSIQERIINILGKIGNEEAIEFLIQNISIPNRRLAINIINTLSKTNYIVPENLRGRIYSEIEANTGNTTWNIAAHLYLTTVQAEHDYKYLKIALEEEIKENYNKLYALLSLLYDKQSIHLVKQNIDSGTPENIGYAIELLDVFVAEELKPFIFPLLEDISHMERVRRLRVLFPTQSFTINELLKQIINKDYFSVNRWTKACALFYIPLNHIQEFINDLTAQLFNPDPMLREIAAWNIFKTAPEKYTELSNRLEKHIASELNIIFDALQKRNHNTPILEIEKIIFLKETTLFDNIPGVMIAELADELSEWKLTEDTTLTYPLQGQSDNLLILQKGEVHLLNNTNIIKKYLSKEVIGDILFTEKERSTITSIKILKGSVLFRLNKNTLYGILYEYPDLAEKFISLVISPKKVEAI